MTLRSENIFSEVEQVLDKRKLVDLLKRASLKNSKWTDIPNNPGIYVVAMRGLIVPEFRMDTGKAEVKSSIALNILREKWYKTQQKEKTDIIYVGKAISLRTRIRQLARFGAGKINNHKGGKHLWQLSNIDKVDVIFQRCPDGKARAYENWLLDKYKADHGSLPLANLSGACGSQRWHPSDVSLTIKLGPVVFKPRPRNAIQNQYKMWDGIEAEERYPSNAKQDYYWLTLSKSVMDSNEVSGVEKELLEALRYLSRAWAFASGYFMKLESRSVKLTPEFSSNAAEIRDNLLFDIGQHHFSLSAYIGSGHSKKLHYRQVPLNTAVNICKATRENLAMEMLLDYFYLSVINDETWFINLYKVRDVLLDCFCCKTRMLATLSISKKSWKFFNNALNKFDLRHPPKIAEKAHGAPQSGLLKKRDRSKVRELARDWIKAYFKHKGISL